MIEVLTSDSLPPPRFRYSPFVKAGPFIKSAGMIALVPGEDVLEEGGVGAETARILNNLMIALPDLGLDLGHIVSATIYTTVFEEFPEINRRWETVFTEDIRPPTRTALGVQNLPLGAKVEMDFLFYKEGS